MPNFTIRVEIDPSRANKGATSVKRSLRGMSDEARDADAVLRKMGQGRSIEDLDRRASGLNRKLAGTGVSVRRVGAELKAFGANGKELTTAQARAAGLDKALQQTTRTTKGLGTAMKAAAVATAGLLAAAGVRKIFDLTQSYTALQNRLRVVTSSEDELKRVTNELFEISERNRVSVESTTEVYSRLAMSADELGLSQDRLLGFTESLGQAVQISGASSAEASAGLIQLSQAMASGTLRGDELNSVMEQLPVVARTIADGLGVTIGELREMGAEGKITAKDIIRAFEKAEGTLKDQFAKTIPTVSQRMEQLRNEAMRFFGESETGQQIMRDLSEVLGVLTDNFETFGQIITIPIQALAEFVRLIKEAKDVIDEFSFDKVFESDIGNRLLENFGGAGSRALGKGRQIVEGEFLRNVRLASGGTTVALAQGGVDIFRELSRRGGAFTRFLDRGERRPGKPDKDAIRRAEQAQQALNQLLDILDPLRAAEEEYLRATGVLFEALERKIILPEQAEAAFAALEEKYKDLRDPLGAIIRDTEAEIELLRMGDEERERHVRLQRLINDARSRGVEITDEVIATFKELVATERQVIADNERMLELADQANDVASTLADQAESVVEGIGDTVSETSQLMLDGLRAAYDGIMGTLQDLATGTKVSFGDMVRSILADLSRLVTSALFQQLIGLLTSTGGGAGISDASSALQAAQGALGLTNLGGFQHGGSVTVPGAGPPDSRIVFARVSPGEQIDFTPRGAEGGGERGVQVNNVVDMSGISALFESPMFARQVWNVIRMDPQALRRLG